MSDSAIMRQSTSATHERRVFSDYFTALAKSTPLIRW